ncbi:hypothetical protein JZ751_029708 [Albula glossodonta]|uniref:Uncharacterized protein n=1 Tax=Albula glossodonta TaxID=121402 RepID=A0A8T2MP01_9TELE|nr:hypothetical protein JZ751_029708 [Albula glossodonta]
MIQESPSSAQTVSSFLHNTMQEFWAALWLLENPEKISEILLRCQTEEGKYLRHILPFLCGFLFKENCVLVRCVVPEDQVKMLSEKLPLDVINTFLGPEFEHENAPLEFETENLLFVCQCLYESQSEKACLHFLNKVGYHLDLSEKHLDPHQCCAVSYVINQAKDRTVQLDLEKSVVTDLGWKLILSCVKKIKMLGLNPSMFSELWETALHCGQQCDFTDVLRVCGNEFHFPVKEQENRSVCVRAGDVLKQSPEKVKLCLHWDQHIYLPPENFTETIFQCLTNIATISFIPPKHQTDSSEEWKRRVSSFNMDLCLQGALYATETEQNITGTLMSALSLNSAVQQSEFLLDLYSHVKDYETQTGRSVLSALQTLYQSAPAEWAIDLSKRKASHFLEVLKLQRVKKPVRLTGWSDKENEVRIFLECLPYISELSFIPPKHQTDSSEEWKRRVSSFNMDLCLQGALYETETEQNITGTLMSALSLNSAVQQSEFLLDLYSHVKDYETQTGRSVLSALQTLYQSAPAEWVIDLSKRKVSLFLKVLKLQTVKKPVRLMGWSDEENEVRNFLECLPYISYLRFYFHQIYNFEKASDCLQELCFQAVVHEAETGQRTVTLLSSVYNFEDIFDIESEIYSISLLDLYSRVKDYEIQTGRSVLSALQTLYQSAPSWWAIDLSKRKASLFLEMLKLLKAKEPVKVMGWSDEENEVRIFLECLPYISELRFYDGRHGCEIFIPLELLFQAAVGDSEAGQTTLTSLLSAYDFQTFYSDQHFDKEYYYFLLEEVCNVLLDLYSRVEDYETKTGRSVLSALQTLYQSGPAEWAIDLSQRKASLFLEVLKLQRVKKPVRLTGWSDEENEVRIFLECLPYISELSCKVPWDSDLKKTAHCVRELWFQAALHEVETGQRTVTFLSSIYSFENTHDYRASEKHSTALLDLYSHVKDYETQTGRSVLSALQTLYQSAPAEWAIDLSKRKASHFLEVLKLQRVKKPVRLTGWSDEENEVRIFLECLPYISELSCKVPWDSDLEKTAHCVRELWFQAALHEVETGQRTVTFLSSIYSFENTHDYRASEKHSTALLDLYSHVKDYETQTGRSFLSALQTLYQSAPAEWAIDLSARKASLFLEVLKLQRVKKPVELLGWSEEENEVKNFLECLPYISQLKLNKRMTMELARVQRAVREELTQCFLQKVGGDLTGCTLDWNVLQYLLPRSTQHFTVDLRKSGIKEQNIRDLLHFLHRIQLKRLNSRFMMAALREIFEMGAGDLVSSLVKSAGNWINLNKRVLDSHDCAALRFILSHTDCVGLSLIWASITEEEIQRTVPLLTRVSQLSVDRKLMLKLLHSCLTSAHQQGAAELLRTLQFKLDFSSSCSVDLTEEEESMSLCLSVSDCRTISMAIQLVRCDTQLLLKDCTIQDAGLEELYPILHRVHLSLSKPLLLQLVCMTPVQDEGRSVSRATALLRALGGELDLSHTPLSLQACRSLALVLDRSDGLAELDLSHCQLTDHCVEPLFPHLHKARVLE